MFEEKLEEAHDILDKAVAVLLKEAYVNFEMHANNWKNYNENDVDLLTDLLDIKDDLLILQSRFKKLAVS